jgi:hypothetical protein
MVDDDGGFRLTRGRDAPLSRSRRRLKHAQELVPAPAEATVASATAAVMPPGRSETGGLLRTPSQAPHEPQDSLMQPDPDCRIARS